MRELKLKKISEHTLVEASIRLIEIYDKLVTSDSKFVSVRLDLMPSGKWEGYLQWDEITLPENLDRDDWIEDDEEIIDYDPY